MRIDLKKITLARGAHDEDDYDPNDPGKCKLCLFERLNIIQALKAGARRPEVTDVCPNDVSPVLHVYQQMIHSGGLPA